MCLSSQSLLNLCLSCKIKIYCLVAIKRHGDKTCCSICFNIYKQFTYINTNEIINYVVLLIFNLELFVTPERLAFPRHNVDGKFSRAAVVFSCGLYNKA